jgi:hypothetical protein
MCFNDVYIMRSAQKERQRTLTAEAKYSDTEITTHCDMKARRNCPLLGYGPVNTRWRVATQQHLTQCFLCDLT